MIDKKKEILEDEDRVARYCGGSKVDDGVIDPGVYFLKREKNEESISVNWLEFFNTDTQVALSEIKQTLIEKKMTIGANSYFAVLGVGIIRDLKERRTIKEKFPSLFLDVRREPEENDQSHAGITGTYALNDLSELAIARVLAVSHSALIKASEL